MAPALPRAPRSGVDRRRGVRHLVPRRAWRRPSRRGGNRVACRRASWRLTVTPMTGDRRSSEARPAHLNGKTKGILVGQSANRALPTDRTVRLKLTGATRSLPSIEAPTPYGADSPHGSLPRRVPPRPQPPQDRPSSAADAPAARAASRGRRRGLLLNKRVAEFTGWRFDHLRRRLDGRGFTLPDEPVDAGLDLLPSLSQVALDPRLVFLAGLSLLGRARLRLMLLHRH